MSNNDRRKFVYELHNAFGQSYGMTTDMYMLPVGTTFTVNNGGWSGSIVEDIDGDKCVYVNYTKMTHKLSPDVDYKITLHNVVLPTEKTDDQKEEKQ